MATLSSAQLPRFAALPGSPAAAPHQGSRFAAFLFAPFADVDDRVARLAAANRAEREARRAASMSGAGAPPRE
jgi:hypothetical protein